MVGRVDHEQPGAGGGHVDPPRLDGHVISVVGDEGRAQGLGVGRIGDVDGPQPVVPMGQRARADN